MTVADPLSLILQRLQIDPPDFYADEVKRLAAPHYAALCEFAILRPLPQSGHIDCGSCGERVQLAFVRDRATGNQHGYMHCPNCGVDEVPADRTRRWRLDISRFLQLLSESGGLEGEPKLLGTGAAWSLGRLRWQKQSVELLFICNTLNPPALETIRRKTKAIALVPTLSIVNNLTASTGRTPLAVEGLISFHGSSIYFDREGLVASIQELGPGSGVRLPSRRRKRSDRAVKIEKLRDEMIVHVAAARDHAFAMQSLTGVPKLLPRPKQTELAKRVGISETDVSRCLSDPSANELRLLWNTAEDLDLVMSWTGGKRRRRS